MNTKNLEYLLNSRYIRIMSLTISLSMGLLGNQVNLSCCLLDIQIPETKEQHLTFFVFKLKNDE